MTRPVDIAIADKSQIVVAGLKQLFAQDERFRVCATADDGASFLQLVDEVGFDIAIIGWLLPQVDGHGILTALRERVQAPSIVVYTGALESDLPRRVMALGGAGFCSKREPPARLMEIVRHVADGQMVFPKFDVRSLHKDPFDELTRRELELLSALAEGATNGQIARKLGISLNTVKFHLKNLYDKLRVPNRAGAVAFYVAHRRRSQ